MSDSPRHDAARMRWGWGLGGLILIAIHVSLLIISPRFAYGELPVLQRPTGLAVTLMMSAGAVYLAAIWVMRLPAAPRWSWWMWIICVGLIMRALMFPSTPILETDYYRYLWDGAVVAHGHNPYEHSPDSIRAGDVPLPIIELRDASGHVIERVNYPSLTTIYPPTAQAGFALGHVICPWHINGLRFVWLLCDLLTLGLLWGLLRQMGMPVSALVVYWWNPLLIKEAYNAIHMELLLLPLLVASLWLAVRHRLLSSGVMLALAVGAKLWPVILFPALLRQSGVTWRQVTMVSTVFVLFACMIVAPMLLTNFDHQAGLRAYAVTWQMNDAIYQVVHLASGWITPDDAHRTARIIIGIKLLLLMAWLCRRPALDGRAVCERALWITACLFLLSPTQYPWYWLWLLPMLVIRPSPGLLILTVMLPLYHLRFPMRELGYDQWFRHGVVWIQFLPTFVLLGWEMWRHVRPGHTLAASRSTAL